MLSSRCWAWMVGLVKKGKCVHLYFIWFSSKERCVWGCVCGERQRGRIVITVCFCFFVFLKFVWIEKGEGNTLSSSKWETGMLSMSWKSERKNVDVMFIRWAGACAWAEGKSVVSLFAGLTGAYVWSEGGKNNGHSIWSTCGEGGTKFVTKVFVGQTYER